MKAVAMIAIVGTATGLQLSRYNREDYDWDKMQKSGRNDFDSDEYECMAEAFGAMLSKTDNRWRFGSNLQYIIYKDLWENGNLGGT